jgi:flagellar basal-body rod modification protein FlgD
MTAPIGAAPTLPVDYSMQNITPEQPKDTLLDPQAFLKLLVAQLKYQDPSKPVDTAAFMSQTATLSQVQTMTSMSASLTALAASQQIQAATSMIGKQITYLDDTGMKLTGVVDAASLSGGAATLQVGDARVPLTRVVEVSTASPASPTTTA